MQDSRRRNVKKHNQPFFFYPGLKDARARPTFPAVPPFFGFDLAYVYSLYKGLASKKAS
jgi:hypothetical protein